MEKKVIVEEITHLVEVITEQNAAINEHGAYIPQIELDITMGNIRNLYERYSELQKLNSIDAPVSKYVEEKKTVDVLKQVVPEIPVVKAVQPVVAEIVEVQEIPVVVTEQTIVVEEKISETLFTEDISVKEEKKVEPEVVAESPVVVEEKAPVTLFAEDIPVMEEKKIEPAVVEKVQENIVEIIETNEVDEITEKKTKTVKKASVDLFSSSTVTVADKFKGESHSINERFSSSTDKKEKSLADKLHEKPIMDLKAAIGINDKFKFINELFDGNLQAYNECVTKLNGFTSFEEAGTFLDLLKKEYGWANENESFTKLTEMVIRRYL
jgi:hypothetical protein